MPIRKGERGTLRDSEGDKKEKKEELKNLKKSYEKSRERGGRGRLMVKKGAIK